MGSKTLLTIWGTYMNIVGSVFGPVRFLLPVLHLHLHLLEYCAGPSNSINSQENYCGMASTQGR
jgi:hypothetical protein